MSGLSINKFFKHKNVYNTTVLRSPVTCTLVVTSIKVEQGAYETFTGDSERNEDSYELNCIYKRDFDQMQRMKFGYEADVSGVVYLSPDQVLEKLGTVSLDETKLRVSLQGFTYGVVRVINHGQIYGSIFAIEIRLSNPTKL